MNRSCLLAGALFLFATAPAGAQDSWKSEHGQECNKVAEDERRVSTPLDEVVDSARFVSGLLAYEQTRRSNLDNVIVWVTAKPGEELKRIRVETGTPSKDRAALEALLKETLRPKPGHPKGLSRVIFLRGQNRPIVSVYTGRVECSSEIANRGDIVFRLSQIVDQALAQGTDSHLTSKAMVRMVVGVDGRPRDIKVTQRNGYFSMAGRAERIIELMRFYPATIDGNPVEHLVRLPITLVGANRWGSGRTFDDFENW